METIRYIDRLVLFEKIRSDEIAQLLAGLIPGGCVDFCGDACAELSLYEPEAASEMEIRKIYYDVQRKLLLNAGKSKISGNYLQDHFCRTIAYEENVFAQMAEKGVYSELEC